LPVKKLLLIAALLLSASCSDTHVSLGEAYVAPATLHVRSELSSKSTSVAELKHGDHLDILDVQRRMVRVRTDKGATGWVDSQQLLSPEQMDQLKQRRQTEAALAPEGSATAYEVLNIHIDPDRQSPAFTQIPEGGAVTILGHKVTPKNTTVRAPGLVIARPQVMSRKQRKEQQNRSVSMRLPPKPAAPKPPANWKELSAERIDAPDEPEPTAKPVAPMPQSKAATKAVVMEDWTLVRTKHSDIGWVLTRNLLMSIPDEVAQYAEGKHITSFFDLGLVNDDVKGPRHNWLWTTAAGGLTYDFDSWRVFLWNQHKHRYETSYRMRELEGYFPVHVEAADAGSPLRTFELITKDDDNKMRRRTYTFDGHRVNLGNTEDYKPGSGLADSSTSGLNTKDLASKAGKQGWFGRQWLTVKHRLWGN